MAKAKRPYQQKARREQQARTRQRIIDALVALHQEIGPKATTVAAVAAKAGVQRLTVYRHFADEAKMLQACSRHYATLHPPPAPDLWTKEPTPLARARAAYSAIYRYYRETRQMLSKIYRDVPDVAPLQPIVEEFDAYFAQIADDVARDLSKNKKRPSKRRRATARFLARFPTWQEMEREGIADAQKAELALSLLQSL